jgi:hypothetical protein
MIASALFAAPAAACSVGMGYRVPNTLELVKRADAIVVAEVVGGEAAEGEGDPQVVFRPTHRIKGKALPGDLRLSGILASETEPAALSAHDELAEPNPDALTGGCRRYVFERGRQIVLFLEEKGGVLEIATYPSARSLEDVRDQYAPWVVAIELYLRIASLPEKKQCAALRKERTRYWTLSADLRAPLYARDIERHIADMGDACRG